MQLGEHRGTGQLLTNALRNAGITQEQFNATGKASPERLALLLQAFEKYGPAVDAYGRTWEAQVATFLDGMRSMRLALTTPLFDQFSDFLLRFNKWMGENMKTLERLSRKLGEFLQTSLNLALRLGPALGPTALGYVGGRAVGSAVGNNGLLNIIVDLIGGGFARSLFGGAIAGAIGTAMGAPLGPMGMGVVGALTAVAGGFLTDKLFRAAVPALGGLGGAAGGGVLGFVASSAPKEATEAAWALGLLGESIADLGASVVRLFTRSPASRFLGRLFTDVAEGLAKGVEGIALVLRGVTYKVNAAVVGLGYVIEALPIKLMATTARIAGDTQQAALLDQTFTAISRAGFAIGQRQSLEELVADLAMPDIKVTNNNNGPINVEIKADRLDDPGTVARTMEDVLRHIAEFPLGARNRGLVPSAR